MMMSTSYFYYDSDEMFALNIYLHYSGIGFIVLMKHQAAAKYEMP